MRKRVLIFLFLILFGFLFINTFHEEYPDEYDSILGGKYLMQGRLIYRDWFQHHQPGAYVLAGIILSFSGLSFIRFRIFLSIVFFLLFIFSYKILSKRFARDSLIFFLIYLIILALLSTYFWGQMLLADTLAAYFLIPAYALLLLKTYQENIFSKNDLLVTNIFTFLCWWTSLTYTFLVLGIIFFSSYLYIKSEQTEQSIIKKIFSALKIILVPYLVFGIYLLITGSIKDYYFANVIYNQRFYIYNYPRPEGAPVNPLRYAIIIINLFSNNFSSIISGIPITDLTIPLPVFLAMSNIAICIYFLVNKRYEFMIFLIYVLIFANSRSNPAKIPETDYQSSVYIVISLFNAIFGIWAYIKTINNQKILPFIRFTSAVLVLIVGYYGLFFLPFAWTRFISKFYPKYMGTMPLIYDRPQVAPVINKIVKSNEYAWVGPFEFKEIFYLKTKTPSKYHWFLQHAIRTKIKDEMINDFEKHPPEIVIFSRQYAPWGGNAAEFNNFFTDYLDRKYLRLYQINEQLQGYRYVWKNSKSQDFDLERDANIRKDHVDELLKRMLESGVAEKIQS